MLRSAWIIGRKEVAQRLRDRSFFIVGIAAPLALAFIFNLVLGGVFGGSTDLNLRFGIVNADSGPISEGFVGVLRQLESEGVITLADYDSAEAAEAAAADDEVGAVFVLPENLSNLVLLGQPGEVRVIGNVDSGITVSIAQSIAEQFSRSVHVGAATARAGLATGALTPEQLQTAATEAGQAAAEAFALTTTEVRSRQLPSSTFFVAGLGMFFAFFVAGMAVSSLLDERSNGTLARLLAAPIPPAAILAGKSGASIVLGCVALGFLAIVSTFLMGADWGNPVMAALVIVGAVFSVAGVMMLVGGLARTSEQAQNLQAIVGVTLSMLGGTFFPMNAEGGLLGTLRYLTPNAWYIRGLGDVVGGAYGEALTSIVVLFAIGIVTGAIGLVLVRRTLRP